jgi:hypothetical protein
MEVDPLYWIGRKHGEEGEGGQVKCLGVEWELTVSGPPPETPSQSPHSFHMDEAVAMETLQSFMGLDRTCLCMYRPVICL